MMLAWGCNNDQQQHRTPESITKRIPFDEARAKKSIISIDTAKRLQQRFIAAREGLIKDTAFRRKVFDIPNAELFSRDAIILLLNQKGADGIRIYYGKDSLGIVRMVLLPVDAKGKDIKTKLVTTQTAVQPGVSPAQARQLNNDGEAIEKGQTCPPCEIEQ